MKSKAFFAAALFLPLLFTGCDKKGNDPAPAPATNNTNTNPGNNNPQTTTGMTAKVDGVDWGAAIPVAKLDHGDFTLMGASFSGKAIGFYSLGNNIAQPGTFSATSIYSEVTPGQTDGPTWGNPLSSFTITKLDTVNKKVSGTFSFTGVAQPLSGATGLKTITNGIFTDITLQ